MSAKRIKAFPNAWDDMHCSEEGMSLSEYYAGLAMQSLIQAGGRINRQGRELVPSDPDYGLALSEVAHDIGDWMELEAAKRRSGS